jgi:hypothetical protein
LQEWRNLQQFRYVKRKLKINLTSFRAVFSTIANESGFDGDITEKTLAYEQQNKVRAAYYLSEYLEQAAGVDAGDGICRIKPKYI